MKDCEGAHLDTLQVSIATVPRSFVCTTVPARRQLPLPPPDPPPVPDVVVAAMMAPWRKRDVSLERLLLRGRVRFCSLCTRGEPVPLDPIDVRSGVIPVGIKIIEVVPALRPVIASAPSGIGVVEPSAR